jgi:hypothetical protein
MPDRAPLPTDESRALVASYGVQSVDVDADEEQADGEDVRGGGPRDARVVDDVL